MALEEGLDVGDENLDARALRLGGPIPEGRRQHVGVVEDQVEGAALKGALESGEVEEAHRREVHDNGASLEEREAAGIEEAARLLIQREVHRDDLGRTQERLE